MTTELYDKAKKIYDESRDLVYKFSDGRSLTGGWLLSQLVENLNDFISGDTEKQFVGYSGVNPKLFFQSYVCTTAMFGV